MSGFAADLEQWQAATAALLAHPPGGLEGAEAARVHRQVRATCDRVLAYAARLLAQVEEDGRWATSGARSFPEWEAERSGASVGAARREARLGKALDGGLPRMGQAVARGDVSLEHAEVLTRLGPTSPVRRATLASDLPDRNEQALVDKAQRMTVDDFRREVRRWAAAVDRQEHEREHRVTAASERLVLLPRDGGVAVEGFLTAENGDVLRTALAAVTGVPDKDDRRSGDERRAAALTALSRLVLDRGLSGGGSQVRPHISVHVTWEQWSRLATSSGGDVDAGPPDAPSPALGETPGEASDAAANRIGAPVPFTGAMVPPAELDDGSLLAPSVFARLACDSEVSRIVFGPDRRPLDVGRSQRTFTGPQRRAVVARDRHCQYPGCRAPAMLGEVHHARWWVRDHGPTAVDNGVLLCWRHHDLVHQRDIRIQWRDGGWEFRRPDGQLIGVRGSPAERGSPPGSRGAREPGDVPGGGASDDGQDELSLAV